MSIPFPTEADRFRVVFLSPRWFVAVKGDELYRLGERISEADSEDMAEPHWE